VGLERGPLNLVSSTEELPRRKSGGCDLETGSVTLTTWQRLSAKLALTSPEKRGRSVGIVSLEDSGHGVVYWLSKSLLPMFIYPSRCY
jgi:hypothetical protein